MTNKSTVGKRIGIGAGAAVNLPGAITYNSIVSGPQLPQCPPGFSPVPSPMGSFTCVRSTGRSLVPPSNR